jgi:hypothetical protein
MKLRPSRKKLHPGDIFVMRLRGAGYVYGKVIRNDAVMQSVPRVLLVYVYDVIQEQSLPIPSLTLKKLLLPPTLINRLPWSRGYFETVGHSELCEEDVLPQHCFRTPFGKIQYFDEYYRELKECCEPCRFYGLDSYYSLSQEIVCELGIEEYPDEE